MLELSARTKVVSGSGLTRREVRQPLESKRNRNSERYHGRCLKLTPCRGVRSS